MSTRDHRREPDADRSSFDDVVDLGSLPPPASGPVDVHRAPTAVATMTDELMDEIRRAKDDVKRIENDRTRVLPKFKMPEDAVPAFTDEMPTRPGKDKEAKAKEAETAPPPPSRPKLRPEAPNLVDAPHMEPVVEILPPTVMDIPDITEAFPAPPVSFAETIPRLTPTLQPRRPVWPRILLVLVTLAAIVVSALALRRYRARHR